MASAELATVIGLMRENNPMQGDTIAAIRANMAVATSALPRPDEVRYEAVDAGGVPAEWTTTPEADPGRVLVYFHGGGYVVGNLDSHRPLVTRISRAAKARVLAVDYRLGPEHPHPAAVEDAVAAYGFARDQGFAPGAIALGGDSAGGGLTVACLLALRERGDPLPAAGVCLSPWLDLTLSGESVSRRAVEDPMTSAKQLKMMAEAYLAGGDPKAPTASPLFADPTGLPPLLIHVGTAEILHDDATRFAERARAAGVDVTLEIWEDMLHVWHVFADLLPEARQAIDRVGAYLRERLG